MLRNRIVIESQRCYKIVKSLHLIKITPKIDKKAWSISSSIMRQFKVKVSHSNKQLLYKVVRQESKIEWWGISITIIAVHIESLVNKWNAKSQIFTKWWEKFRINKQTSHYTITPITIKHKATIITIIVSTS